MDRVCGLWWGSSRSFTPSTKNIVFLYLGFRDLWDHLTLENCQLSSNLSVQSHIGEHLCNGGPGEDFLNLIPKAYAVR